MCGLFGLILSNGSTLTSDIVERARSALNTLVHRGPDQHGEKMDERAYIGHRRLSILDLSDAGRQPMVSQDKHIIIAVNGEVYNFQDLRRAIGEDQFVSASDSEVVLQGYIKWGIDGLLQRMDGMYAGIIYDTKNQQLHLFRDRIGIKPLYYGDIAGALCWASELKAIRSYAGEHCKSVDSTSLLDFAALRYVPYPKTIYKNVFKLPPAHYLTIELQTGRRAVRKYWQLEVDELNASHAEMARMVREALAESVEQQLVSDVPLGFFLSGGVDSSILTALAAQKQEDINTFSIGFDDPDHDETRYAQIVADRFQTRHVRKTVGVDDAANLFDRMDRWYDEPYGDTSALPTYHVCALAQQSCTVALSGDGGDELFGGYNWYRRYWRYRRWTKQFAKVLPAPKPLPFRRPPRSIAEKLTNRVAFLAQFDAVELYASLMPNLLASELSALRAELEIDDDYDPLSSLRQHYRPQLGPYKALQYLDFHTWLPDDILTKVDRVSMDVSLEVRVPFLSKKVSELAFGLPESFLYKDGALKGGLKYAFADMLPKNILHREKKGFSIPKKTWAGSILAGQSTYQMAYVRHFLDQRKRS